MKSLCASVALAAMLVSCPACLSLRDDDRISTETSALSFVGDFVIGAAIGGFQAPLAFATSLGLMLGDAFYFFRVRGGEVED